MGSPGGTPTARGSPAAPCVRLTPAGFWPPTSGIATPTDLTRLDSNYRLTPRNGPTPPCTTSTPAECCGPGFSAA